MRSLFHPVAHMHNDTSNDFKVRGVNTPCYLFCAMNHPDYVNQSGMIGWDILYAIPREMTEKAQYTQEEWLQLRRFWNMVPLQPDELVLIDGLVYRTEVNLELRNPVVFQPL